MIGKTRVCPNANPFFYGASFAVNEVEGVSTGTTYTPTEDDFTILANAKNGAVTINLPDARNCKGRVYIIKKIDDEIAAVTINGYTYTEIFDGTPTQFTQTIDGNNTITLTTENEARMIQSDGANWYVIGPLNITITSP